MIRYKFGTKTIRSAGYNALCAILEVEFAQDGQIWHYTNVPEEIWYHLRNEKYPDSFFHQHIKGHYRERRIFMG